MVMLETYPLEDGSRFYQIIQLRISCCFYAVMLAAIRANRCTAKVTRLLPTGLRVSTITSRTLL
jgi:hypothetical protein